MEMVAAVALSSRPATLPVPRFGQARPDAAGRDAAKIAEEIVQHLTSMIGAEVEVTLEIQAHIPDGASPELVRTITENCRTLKFADHGFEEE